MPHDLGYFKVMFLLRLHVQFQMEEYLSGLKILLSCSQVSNGYSATPPHLPISDLHKPT